MSDQVSLDGAFVIHRSGQTLEAEEIPTVVAAVGRILLECVALYEDVIERDPVGVGRAVVAIYDQLTRIKKEVED